jgi:hypothetical protein
MAATHKKMRPMKMPTIGRFLFVEGICRLLTPKRIEATPIERNAPVINEARATFV